MPYYAVIFKKDFEPGDHWNPNADDRDPDRLQHWKKGDLYSVGTVLPAKLPFHLEAIELPEPPPPGARWDAEQRAFVAPDPESLRQSQIAYHKDELARLGLYIDGPTRTTSHD